DYTGTVVFVSHDRYFIDKLATRVFEIGDGKVEIYPGNYEDYLWRKQGGAEKQAESLKELQKTVVVPAASNGNRNGARSEPEPVVDAGPPKKRINPIKRKQMEDRSKELEGKIAELEDEIARIESALQNFVSAEESQRQAQELEKGKSDHAALLREWEELA